MWSLITQKIVTLHELENDYSLDDFYRLLAFCEYKGELEDAVRKTEKSKIK